MSDFFQMGGYAFYVWSAYILALIVLTFNLIIPIRRRRKILRSFARRFRHEQRL